MLIPKKSAELLLFLLLIATSPLARANWRRVSMRSMRLPNCTTLGWCTPQEYLTVRKGSVMGGGDVLPASQCLCVLVVGICWRRKVQPRRHKGTKVPLGALCGDA